MMIKELMTRGVHSIGPEGTLFQASRQMKAYGVGLLAVCEMGRLLGVLTDRDIVVRALAEDRDPAETRAKEVMTVEPVWCYEEDQLEDAVRLMGSWHIRRVPVLDKAHQLVGLLSLDDIARPENRRELAGELLEKTSSRRPPAAL